MGIFNTYDLLAQTYKTLPSNDTFCKYWVCETQNHNKCTVSITNYLQNAYVYQLSGMKNDMEAGNMILREHFGFLQSTEN